MHLNVRNCSKRYDCNDVDPYSTDFENMFTKWKDAFLKDIVLHIKDIKSLNQLNQLHDTYLPWSGASLHPTAMVYILNDIMINNRKVMVECGAGISTFHTASLLNQIGSDDRKLYSVDHNKKWLTLLQQELEKHHLDHYVELIHAPLTACPESYQHSAKWYDTHQLDTTLPSGGIDLLFVDGPPANKKEIQMARLPAFYYFREKMSDECTVIIDDADRRGEQQLAKTWQEAWGVPFTKSILDGNIITGRRGPAFNVM
jgi:predicted O-methyltransferase YrrM